MSFFRFSKTPHISLIIEVDFLLFIINNTFFRFKIVILSSTVVIYFTIHVVLMDQQNQEHNHILH